MPTNVWGRARSRPGVFNSLFAFLLFLAPISVHASSPLIIGEVNWAGSSHSNADEWVEIWNISAEERSLAGWSLEGASGDPILFSETMTVPAYGTFILSNYDETNPKSSLNTSTQLVTTNVALSNEALHLVLKDAQGVVIDEAGDGTKPPAGLTKPLTSMLRANTLTNTWTHSTSSYGLDPDVTDLGTPGTCDGCTRAEEMDTPIESTHHVESPPEEPLPVIDTSSTSPLIPEIPTPLEEETTSTMPVTDEPEIVPDEPVFTDTTSTEPEIIPELADPEPSSPSSTVEILDEESSPSTSSTEALPEIETPCTWRLSNILPAPSDGQERITLAGCHMVNDLLGLVLRDTQGIFLTVTSSTPYLLTSTQGWQLTLPSQRLNNSGDSVLLYAADGRLLDSVSYPSMQHDEHYTRLEDGTWWIPERAPPPPSTVSITPPTSVNSSNNTSPSVLSTTSSTSPVVTSTATTVKKRGAISTTTHASTSSTKAVTPSKKVTSMSWAEYTASKARGHTTSSKAAVTKTTKAATTTRLAAKKTTTSMTTSSANAPRVLLHGTVGTPPNLIAKRRFVLLNADGTGLLVYGSTSQASPPMGSSITIHGTLVTNDDGTHLEMRTRDRWEFAKTTLPPPKTNSVDLLSVESSQAWSLTEFTGRVLSRGTTSARIETSDMELTIALPAVLGYRAQRLQVGDTIRVRGVLDVRSATPRLYPRTPDEITILVPKANAASISTPVTQTNLPPWAPIGAAAATIAGGYGFMRWRTWHKQKQLERQLTLAIDQLSS
jgi:hypothetical protein